MITRLEYLKKCITNLNIIEYKSWYISCFAIPILKNNQDWKKTAKLYSVVTQQDGLYYIEKEEDYFLVKISDYKRDTPLFNFQESIDVDSTWLASIDTPQSTKIGVLTINALILYPCFKSKVSYINSTIKVSTIEDLLASRVKNDDVATDKDITVKEMIECIDRLSFLSQLSTLINIAATPRTISKPDNIDEIRVKLLKEYEGQLHDPIKIVELENKLQEVDNKYLEDDIASKKIFSNKSRIARKKLFLMFGETADFETPEQANLVIPPLSEGLSVEDKDFVKYINDARYGSYSRGASTQLGGYSYKILQRSLSSLSISPTPCNTTRGFKRQIDEKNYSKLTNRYVKEKDWVLINTSQEAKQYIGKQVEIRSSMYCTTQGKLVCYKCMSENYKDTPNGINNLAANISNTLISLFMKMMHGTIVEAIEIDMKDLVT